MIKLFMSYAWRSNDIIMLLFSYYDAGQMYNKTRDSNLAADKVLQRSS